MPAWTWSRSPPTAPPASEAPTPTRPPTRSASSAPSSRPWTFPAVVPDVLARFGGREPPERRGLPLHLNVQLDDPLVPGDRWTERAGGAGAGGTPGVAARAGRGPRRDPAGAADRGGRRRRQRSAGAGAGRARELAALAEPTSGSRTGTHAIRTYRLLLGTPLADEVERVIVFGHPTLVAAGVPTARPRRRRGVERSRARRVGSTTVRRRPRDSAPGGRREPGHRLARPVARQPTPG